MKHLLVVCTLFFSTFIFTDSAWAVKLNLKPGVYNMQSKMLKDGKTFDPLAQVRAQMANMPPEVRAMMEKQVNATDFLKDRKICILAESLDSKKFREDFKRQNKQMKSCKHKILKETAKEIKATMKCKEGNSSIHMQFLSPTSFKQTIEGNVAGNQNVQIVMQAKREGAKCPPELLKEAKEQLKKKKAG